MSLRIWLPLTYDLRNQGSANASVTNTSVVINANGKLGKCYSFGTGKSYLKFNDVNFMHNMTECSVSLWLKILTWNTSYATYFQFGLGSTPWAHYIFGLLRNNANSTLCFTISNGTNATNANCLTPTITLNEWYHLTFTYSNGHCKIYVNGAETNDYTTTIVPNFAGITTGIIGACNNGNNYQTNCLMNDFRVYDHCLSPEEVREIANGLVLHYKLDGFKNGYGAPNLLKNSQTLGTGFGGSGTTIQNAFGKFAAKYKDNTSGTSYSDTLTYSNAVTVNPSEIYTASFWAKADTEHSIICYFYNNTSGIVQATHRSASNGLNGTPSSDGATTLTITTEWQYYWITWTFGTSGTAAAKTLLLGRQSAGNSGVYIAAPKLEKNDAPTAWAPAATDAGAEFDTIIDNSGYGHDGIITGTLLHSSDAGKYNSSFYITNGQTNYITTIDEIGNFSSGITINTWFKTNCKSPPGRYHAILTDLTTDYHDTIFLISIHDSGFFHGGIKINNSLTISSTHHTTLCNGEWHMVTLTYDGTVMKRYVDGIHAEEADQALTGTISAAFSQFKIGNSTAFGEAAKELYINDMRIYVTPLLDSEIKKLYNIGMGMDNKNQIHTYEFNEFAATPQLHKTGVLDGLINEFPYCPYDQQIYVEPDGSAWIRIYHHNNPAAAVFASSDSFTTSVYKDEDRWFYVSLCNLVDKWELMVKSKYTTSSTEIKRRWVQTINPMTATFAQVAAANITENTDTGYSHSTWGGLYHIGSSTYLCANNGTNGNWWGAVGAWSQHQGGIPGWLGTPTTTGYNDLYLRIDNVQFSNIMLHNDINWLVNGAIER